jgi:hypothetical protein
MVPSLHHQDLLLPQYRHRVGETSALGLDSKETCDHFCFGTLAATVKVSTTVSMMHLFMGRSLTTIPLESLIQTHFAQGQGFTARNSTLAEVCEKEI